MPFCRHCECESGSPVLSLLTVNRQWFSESGGKEKQLPRESVLNLDNNPHGVGAHNFSKYGSQVRSNRKGEQEINPFTPIILLSASGFDGIWEIFSGKEGSEWLSHFCLSKKRKELKKQEF